VAGLKTSFRYAEVRLEYAGESTIERRRVVKDDGKDERDSERENGMSGLDWGDSEATSLEDGGVGSDIGGSDVSKFRNSAKSRSCWRCLPIPMFS